MAKLCCTRFCWMTHWAPAAGFMDISGDCKTATLGIQHKWYNTQAWGSVGFSQGLYKWRLRISVMEDAKITLGVTAQPCQPYHAHSAGRYAGFSSEGDIICPKGTVGQRRQWTTGAVITVQVNCGLRQLTVWENDNLCGVLPTPEGKLWPWVNAIGRKAAVTLMNSYSLPSGKA